MATDLNNLAQLLHEFNWFDDAEPLMRRALAIFERSFNLGHPNVLITVTNLTALLEQMGKKEAADTIRKRYNL